MIQAKIESAKQRKKLCIELNTVLCTETDIHFSVEDIIENLKYLSDTELFDVKCDFS